MDRDSVRKMVQNYINKNNLSNPEFARQAKINDRTVRRLLNSEESISDSNLKNWRLLVYSLNSPSLALILVKSTFVVNITRTVLAGSIHRYALVTPTHKSKNLFRYR